MGAFGTGQVVGEKEAEKSFITLNLGAYTMRNKDCDEGSHTGSTPTVTLDGNALVAHFI